MAVELDMVCRGEQLPPPRGQGEWIRPHLSHKPLAHLLPLIPRPLPSSQLMIRCLCALLLVPCKPVRLTPPLKSWQVSNWEGGIRVNSWISGGFLPPSRRGTVAMDLSSSFDWYATSCALAGVDPTDARAEASGLPPIDSINLWPWLSGKQSRSPRTSFEVG